MNTEQNNQQNLNTQSDGLGDTIAKVTHALGVDKLAETVAHAVGKDDCGCNKRRQKLNDLFPYKSDK
jgi:hypothetical protein